METDKKFSKKNLVEKNNEMNLKKSKNDLFQERIKPNWKFGKISMIPKLKLGKSQQKCDLQEQKELSSASKVSCFSLKDNDNQNITYEKKLKLLDSKEKSIAEYYAKIEELFKKMMAQEKTSPKTECQKSLPYKIPLCSASTRKMTSDPSIFNKTKVQSNVLNKFENNVQQISNIWLETSTDLSNMLNNLASSTSLDPIQFQVESMRMQLAIKQAKSLTLVKSKSVLAEAKKLILHQGMVKTDLERAMVNKKNQIKSCEYLKKKDHKIKDAKADIKEMKSIYINNKGDTNEAVNENTKICSNDNLMGEEEGEKKHTDQTPSEMNEVDLKSDEAKNNCFAEPPKKNETITQLNKKIFELQKACNEYSHKYNQLQLKLADYNEKIQWNEVLWKQIGNIKCQMRELQESNKQLESQKKDLELKISEMDVKLDKLIKLNFLLHKKKCTGKFINSQSNECIDTKKENVACDVQDKSQLNKKVLAEKHKIINHLKMLLDLMKDQECIAKKQIQMFELKIDELKKVKNVSNCK